MAEYIPLDHMRQLDKPMEEWTSPTGRPATHASHEARLRGLRHSVSVRRRIGAALFDLPSLILIGFLVMLAVMI